MSLEQYIALRDLLGLRIGVMIADSILMEWYYRAGLDCKFVLRIIRANRVSGHVGH